MATYFIDSSALAKRYITETGTLWLKALTEPATGNVIIIARITAVELIAAITRRARGGTLDLVDAMAARSKFRVDLASEYQVVEITEARLNQAMLLAEGHALRGYDAVQLAVALDVNVTLVAKGRSPIILISADTELNSAAAAEGLAVENPNSHH